MLIQKHVRPNSVRGLVPSPSSPVRRMLVETFWSISINSLPLFVVSCLVTVQTHRPLTSTHTLSHCQSLKPVDYYCPTASGFILYRMASGNCDFNANLEHYPTDSSVLLLCCNADFPNSHPQEHYKHWTEMFLVDLFRAGHGERALCQTTKVETILLLLQYRFVWEKTRSVTKLKCNVRHRNYTIVT